LSNGEEGRNHEQFMALLEEERMLNDTVDRRSNIVGKEKDIGEIVSNLRLWCCKSISDVNIPLSTATELSEAIITFHRINRNVYY